MEGKKIGFITGAAIMAFAMSVDLFQFLFDLIPVVGLVASYFFSFVGVVGLSIWFYYLGVPFMGKIVPATIAEMLPFFNAFPSYTFAAGLTILAANNTTFGALTGLIGFGKSLTKPSLPNAPSKGVVQAKQLTAIREGKTLVPEKGAGVRGTSAPLRTPKGVGSAANRFSDIRETSDSLSAKPVVQKTSTQNATVPRNMQKTSSTLREQVAARSPLQKEIDRYEVKKNSAGEKTPEAKQVDTIPQKTGAANLAQTSTSESQLFGATAQNSSGVIHKESGQQPGTDTVPSPDKNTRAVPDTPGSALEQFYPPREGVRTPRGTNQLERELLKEQYEKMRDALPKEERELFIPFDLLTPDQVGRMREVVEGSERYAKALADAVQADPAFGRELRQHQEGLTALESQIQKLEKQGVKTPQEKERLQTLNKEHQEKADAYIRSIEERVGKARKPNF